MVGQREEKKGEEKELSGAWSLRLVESIAGSSLCLSLDRSKISLVAWLLCFSDLQLEPQNLSLGFYYSYCRESLNDFNPYIFLVALIFFLFVFITITTKGESGLIFS